MLQLFHRKIILKANLLDRFFTEKDGRSKISVVGSIGLFVIGVIFMVALNHNGTGRNGWDQGAGIEVHPGKPVVSPSGEYILSMICTERLSEVGKCHFVIKSLPGLKLVDIDSMVEFSIEGDFSLYWSENNVVVMHFEDRQYRWKKAGDIWQLEGVIAHNSYWHLH